MLSKNFYGILLILSSLIGFSQRTIVGRLIDEETGEPVKYAVVETNSGSTKTNYSGYFQLSIAPPDTKLTISHIAYQNQWISVPDVNNFLLKLQPEVLVTPELYFLDFVYNDSAARNSSHIVEFEADSSNCKPVRGWGQLYSDLGSILKRVERRLTMQDFDIVFDVSNELSIANISVSGDHDETAWVISNYIRSIQWRSAKHDGLAVTQKVRMPVKVQDKIFTEVDEPAQFPGGKAALEQFLVKNLKLPRRAYKMGIRDVIKLQLIVEKDGTLSNINTIKYYGAGLENAAYKALQKSGKWIPAKVDGENVIQQLIQEIDFGLARELADDESYPEPEFYSKFQVTTAAEFPGGNDAYYEYLSRQIKYPESIKENGIEGSVTLFFKVDSNGKPVDIDTYHSIKELILLQAINNHTYDDDPFKEEIEKAVLNMPSFKPAKADRKNVGQAVDITTVLFALSDSTMAYAYLYDVVISGSSTQPAKFPGGRSELINYLNKKKQKIWDKLPLNKNDNKVTAEIEISELGEVNSFEIVKGLTSAFNEDISRLIEKMPNWIPAKDNGTPIASTIMFEIDYSNSANVNLSTAKRTYRTAIKYIEKEKYDSAVEYLKMSIDKAPHIVNYYQKMAAVYIKMNDLEKACETLKIIEEYDDKAKELIKSYCGE